VRVAALESGYHGYRVLLGVAHADQSVARNAMTIPPRPRIGLVLGAGGVVGQAYQCGVLAVLENDCGFDARDAEVIVGTSAGAVIGMLLRLGVAPGDLAAWMVKAPLAEEHEVLRRMAEVAVPEFVPFRVARLFRRPPRPPGWRLLRNVVTRRPWFNPLPAALTLIAPGRQDILTHLAALQEFGDQAWPDRDLWICAVRRRDARRVVFGRPGAPEAPLRLAVAASCAVPGYFAPVQIDDHAYLDGGVHSLTNAAILKERGLDLVIVISPMSGPLGHRPDVYAAARYYAARTLRREVKALRAANIQTLVFAPGDREQQVIGNDFMSGRRVTEIIRHSFFAAGAQAANPDVRAILRAATTQPEHNHASVP
jgi:NTE family protein